mmetsp:Transcript_27102/g.87558  ORF Transcript_27102/g.87558 Transcript_27102/m.87558 type:complete len:585 (-) Transcript_27102:85-1839(-)
MEDCSGDTTDTEPDEVGGVEDNDTDSEACLSDLLASSDDESDEETVNFFQQHRCGASGRATSTSFGGCSGDSLVARPTPPAQPPILAGMQRVAGSRRSGSGNGATEARLQPLFSASATGLHGRLCAPASDQPSSRSAWLPPSAQPPESTPQAPTLQRQAAGAEWLPARAPGSLPRTPVLAQRPRSSPALQTAPAQLLFARKAPPPAWVSAISPPAGFAPTAASPFAALAAARLGGATKAAAPPVAPAMACSVGGSRLSTLGSGGAATSITVQAAAAVGPHPAWQWAYSNACGRSMSAPSTVQGQHAAELPMCVPAAVRARGSAHAASALGMDEGEDEEAQVAGCFRSRATTVSAGEDMRGKYSREGARKRQAFAVAAFEHWERVNQGMGKLCDPAQCPNGGKCGDTLSLNDFRRCHERFYGTKTKGKRDRATGEIIAKECSCENKCKAGHAAMAAFILGCYNIDPDGNTIISLKIEHLRGVCGEAMRKAYGVSKHFWGATVRFAKCRPPARMTSRHRRERPGGLVGTSITPSGGGARRRYMGRCAGPIRAPCDAAVSHAPARPAIITLLFDSRQHFCFWINRPS